MPASVASDGNDVEDIGFAKLHGQQFEFFMQAYEMILGRDTKKEKVDLDLSVLGGGKDISRYHARIFYDFKKHLFFLEVLGRTGCTIQGTFYRPGDDPVILKSQDLIQIGELKFYFLLPRCSIFETLAARRAHVPSQPPSSPVRHPAHVPSHPPSSSDMHPAHVPSQPPSTSVTRPAHVLPQALSSSIVRPSRAYTYGIGFATPARRHNHIPSQHLSSSFMRPADTHFSDFLNHSYGNDHLRGKSDNGTRVGTEHQGMLMNQSLMTFGELCLYTGPFNVEPIGILGDGVNNVKISTDKDTGNQQLQLKEEKDIISCVATLISNYCAPREWMPVQKLHSELIDHFGKIWPRSKVQKHLVTEDGPSTETRLWYKMLELLKKHPLHFIISTVTRGTVTSEFVTLESLLI